MAAGVGSLIVSCYCWCAGDHVRVLLNEEPIRLPICNGSEFCELNEFVDGSSKLTEQWRTFQDICS